MLFDKPQRFRTKWKKILLRTIFSTKFAWRPFETSNNTTWWEGRWTGEGNHVLTGGFRVFLTSDRQTKCLDGDRQRTVWSLDQHELHYLRNRRTECVLTVSYRRNGKLGYRVISLSFCVAQHHMYPRISVPSDVYSDMYVKHVVLWRERLCEPWSTSLK